MLFLLLGLQVAALLVLVAVRVQHRLRVRDIIPYNIETTQCSLYSLCRYLNIYRYKKRYNFCCPPPLDTKQTRIDFDIGL